MDDKQFAVELAQEFHKNMAVTPSKLETKSPLGYMNGLAIYVSSNQHRQCRDPISQSFIVTSLRIVASYYLLTLATQNLPARNSGLFLLLRAKSNYA